MLIVENFDCKEGIGRTFDVGNPILETLGIRCKGILKLDRLNSKLNALDAELDLHAVPVGFCQQVMSHVALDLSRVQQAFDNGGHLIDDRSAVRRFTRKYADLFSDGLPDFGIGEPRKIVERNRISGRFLDLKLQVDRLAFGSVAEVDRGEYSESGETVRGVLDLLRGNDVAR